ncbi:hypothetical protein Y032_0017g3446 [Ancylostoma ceylanicum]|uniref:Uncharacterized protein n=1 Tax=Ancylostoma ceylanicum TaxID=53326 RepID=A0A016V595_9BILA|nr:hypothetical protein Y032_0017g3446 [Ancylostoma ceylanicum]
MKRLEMSNRFDKKSVFDKESRSRNLGFAQLLIEAEFRRSLNLFIRRRKRKGNQIASGYCFKHLITFISQT